MTGWNSKPEWPSQIWPDLASGKVIGLDLGNGADETVVVTGKVEDGKLHVQEFYKSEEAENILKSMPINQIVLTTFENGELKRTVLSYDDVYLKETYHNTVPTHDPYTNPKAELYHECLCGAILDPGTKSFASLNSYASRANWKIRWKQNGDGYQAYCEECGKDIPE